MAIDVIAEPPSRGNLAKLLKTAYDGADLTLQRGELLAYLETHPASAATLMDLCVVEEVLGCQASGLSRQSEALRHHRLYRSSWPASPEALRVLAFMTPGDLGANMPIEFLLQNSDVVLYSLYVVPGEPLPNQLPDHDIAIVIASESDQVRPVMRDIEYLIPNWPRPVLNRPDQILRLSREQMYRALETVSGVVMPATVRVERASLETVARGVERLGRYLAGAAFPLIVRTVGSHAGRGLAKLYDAVAIQGYLAEHPEAEFYISPFIDYRSPDGLFRKYRIIWIDGQPYPCHMAIANEWKVWYLNAGMADCPAKRAEEATFMAAFDDDFACRHAAALRGIVDRFGLEYMGIDCAELPDGSLLVFEGDVALVAHDMDPPDIYPYKGAPMRRLFTAFYDMLKRKSRHP